MKKNKLFCGILLCCLSACFIEGNDNVANEQREKQGHLAVNVDKIVQASFDSDSICYVLCDFSNSQDVNSRNDIVDNAKTIFEKINDRFRVAYFSINAPRFQKPFFVFEAPNLTTGIKPQEFIKRKNQLKLDKALLAQRLDSFKNAEKANHSCIIQALDKVASLLAMDTQNKFKPIRIVILSDMLEVCQNDFGSINLENKSYNQALAVIKRMKRPLYRFVDYSKLSIDITASSPKMISGFSELNSFWKQVFEKYGYILNKPITAELPAWLNK